MSRRKFTNTESQYTCMSLEIQLMNVETALEKHPKGSPEVVYLEKEREVLQARLEALK